uniref:Cupin type-1 domain-containing protein n=1 Tax=Aureoumbra lagunensis TaxID=44058 RepID=A0A6S8DNF9_9STRA|mmetsp:Transcript_4558/g.6466  ORF Transcript_4558/g.6466 Transcript_4558/m.6466 type:complete len:386 (-) Transcript_4558:466-1623(-)
MMDGQYPRVVSHEQLRGAEKSAVDAKEKDGALNWTDDVRIYEYCSAANPDIPAIPVFVHPPHLHETGDSRIIPFDLSEQLGAEECGNISRTSPNLLASFIRIIIGDSIQTEAVATSQAFYVIRGDGTSTSMEHGSISWSTGDLFVLPKTDGIVKHTCQHADEHGAAALYWIHDGPLLHYLGVAPTKKRFNPTHFSRRRLLDQVEEISHSSNAQHKNRLGVLLGNAATENSTLTLTHTLWSLLNSIAPNTVQRPHRHNSVALDLAVSAPWPPGSVYTLMGKEIDSEGNIIHPIRCDWIPGGVFVTPPGWWHSHHNESNSIAWVLPMQDAGLYTFQRTLDIRFVDDELELHKKGRIRGSAFQVTNKQYTEIANAAANLDIPNFDYGL